MHFRIPTWSWEVFHLPRIHWMLTDLQSITGPALVGGCCHWAPRLPGSSTGEAAWPPDGWRPGRAQAHMGMPPWMGTASVPCCEPRAQAHVKEPSVVDSPRCNPTTPTWFQKARDTAGSEWAADREEQLVMAWKCPAPRRAKSLLQQHLVEL